MSSSSAGPQMEIKEKDYVEASEERIGDAAKASGIKLPAFVMTAIHVELKTMIEVGKRLK